MNNVLAELQALYDAEQWSPLRQRAEQLLSDSSQPLGDDRATVARLWGLALYELGQYEEAIEALQQAARLDPGDWRAWNGRGAAFLALDQPLAAEPDFSHALSLAPPEEQWRLLVNRGIARTRLVCFDEALADFNHALELRPGLALVLFYRGYLYGERNEHEKALADLTAVLQQEPRNVAAWNNRGLSFYELGRDDEARADFDHALQVDPSCGNAWNNRALLRQRQGDLAGALADFTQAIELDPEDSRARANRAELLQQMGQPEAALADFQNALACDPDHVIWREQTIEVLLRLGRAAEALELLGWFRDQEMQTARHHWLRARAYQQLGDSLRARIELRQATRLDPLLADAYRLPAVSP